MDRDDEGAKKPKTNWTKDYLETLSTIDLYTLSDEYTALFGNSKTTVIKALDRDILIADILSAIADIEDADDEEEDINTQKKADKFLPAPYNSTEVEIVMLNSACAFVYWNISTLDRRALNNAKVSELKIRLNCFSTPQDEKESADKKADRYFDFSISKDDNCHYFLLPAGQEFLRADLLFFLDGIVDILASSRVAKTLRPTDLTTPEHLWSEKSFSPIMKLSGVEHILKNYYNNNTVSLIS